MKFKVGDLVRIKKMTPAERKHPIMHYNLDMHKHEGKIARIYAIDNDEEVDMWFYRIGFGRKRWCYVEEWVEAPNEFTAF